MDTIFKLVSITASKNTFRGFKNISFIIYDFEIYYYNLFLPNIQMILVSSMFLFVMKIGLLRIVYLIK